jgi:hypothetical protein
MKFSPEARASGSFENRIGEYLHVEFNSSEAVLMVDHCISGRVA